MYTTTTTTNDDDDIIIPYSILHKKNKTHIWYSFLISSSFFI